MAAAVGAGGLLRLQRESGAKLHGKWNLDVEQSLAASDLADGEKRVLAGLIALTGAQFTVEFRADGTLASEGSSTMGAGFQSGQWEVVEAEGDSMQLKITPEQGVSKQQSLTFVDAEHIRVATPGEKISAVIFTKAAQ